MTRTQYPMSYDYAVPGEFYGDFVEQYDTQAVNAAVCDAINAALPGSISLHRNGQITYDVGESIDVFQAVLDAAESVARDRMEAIICAHEILAETDADE